MKEVLQKPSKKLAKVWPVVITDQCLLDCSSHLPLFKNYIFAHVSLILPQKAQIWAQQTIGKFFPIDGFHADLCVSLCPWTDKSSILILVWHSLAVSGKILMPAFIPTKKDSQVWGCFSLKLGWSLWWRLHTEKHILSLIYFLTEGLNFHQASHHCYKTVFSAFAVCTLSTCPGNLANTEIITSHHINALEPLPYR